MYINSVGAWEFYDVNEALAAAGLNTTQVAQSEADEQLRLSRKLAWKRLEAKPHTDILSEMHTKKLRLEKLCRKAHSNGDLVIVFFSSENTQSTEQKSNFDKLRRDAFDAGLETIGQPVIIGT